MMMKKVMLIDVKKIARSENRTNKNTNVNRFGLDQFKRNEKRDERVSCELNTIQSN